MQRINLLESEFTMLLARPQHECRLAWNEAFDNPVGVPNLVVNTIARTDQSQLLSGGRERGLELLAGILPQTAENDLTHFIPQAFEPAKIIEDAGIPEEVIAGRWQLVTVRAELVPGCGTMVVEIVLDDPILQHASE